MLRTTCRVSRFFLCIPAAVLFAQDKPGPDVLVLVDGEKLIGHLKSATGSKVVFKSDMAGQVTVEWSKIQELRSGSRFAVVPKGVEFRTGADAEKVAQGTLEMTNQKLAVSSAATATPKDIPVSDVSNVLEETTFQRALHRQSLREGWTGGAAFGMAVTESTFNSRTITTSVDLMRSDPSENWLQLRNRTAFNLNLAYGQITASGAPTAKTELYNAGLVHDFYFSPRWFAFAGATWEHNFSQGLDLLQAYGGGLGAVVIKGEHSELDVRAGLGFMNQRFSDPTLNKNLIGSRFGETYYRTFAHGITLTEQAGIRPAWNYPKAFFGGFLAALTLPVYHRLGVQLSSFDSFINNPPPGFKKNTFQFTIGANYAFK